MKLKMGVVSKEEVGSMRRGQGGGMSLGGGYFWCVCGDGQKCHQDVKSSEHCLAQGCLRASGCALSLLLGQVRIRNFSLQECLAGKAVGGAAPRLFRFLEVSAPRFRNSDMHQRSPNPPEFAQPRFSSSNGGHPQQEGTNLGVFVCVWLV